MTVLSKERKSWRLIDRDLLLHRLLQHGVLGKSKNCLFHISGLVGNLHFFSSSYFKGWFFFVFLETVFLCIALDQCLFIIIPTLGILTLSWFQNRYFCHVYQFELQWYWRPSREDQKGTKTHTWTMMFLDLGKHCPPSSHRPCDLVFRKRAPAVPQSVYPEQLLLVMLSLVQWIHTWSLYITHILNILAVNYLVFHYIISLLMSGFWAFSCQQTFHWCGHRMGINMIGFCKPCLSKPIC